MRYPHFPLAAAKPGLNHRGLASPRIGGMRMLFRLLRDEDGATAIEYGLIAALISLAALIAFQSLGLNLATVFNTITNAMAGR